MSLTTFGMQLALNPPYQRLFRRILARLHIFTIRMYGKKEPDGAPKSIQNTAPESHKAHHRAEGCKTQSPVPTKTPDPPPAQPPQARPPPR
jgi:hypothetical protein